MLKKIWNWIILNLHTTQEYKRLAKLGIIKAISQRPFLQEVREASYLNSPKDKYEHILKECLHGSILHAKAGKKRWWIGRKTPILVNIGILERTIRIYLEKELQLFLN